MTSSFCIVITLLCCAVYWIGKRGVSSVEPLGQSTGVEFLEEALLEVGGVRQQQLHQILLLQLLELNHHGHLAGARAFREWLCKQLVHVLAF